MIKTLLIGGLGTTELILIVLLILLFFGAAKIPQLMRGLGRGVKEFKDAVNGEGVIEEEEEKSDENPSEK
ncbi:MAG: twin-arginine translocase TatA/TatE family subunit [Alistipes sp.]|nr:twin-arginine translocase TatA/TatE family subunit [Alistipes sp.]